MIVDLTRWVAGPYCTLQFAELGARVIKVEPPGEGDEARSLGPMHDGISAYFRSINHDKESITLDLKDQGDRSTFEQLLSSADVLVENYRPGVMQRLGYDWAELKERFPRLVVASISGFGQTGPYAGRASYDLVAQAMGGIMSITGQSVDSQTRVGASIGDLAAGMFAAIAIQAAIIERMRTDLGSYVDIAMLDCQIALLESAVSRYHLTGIVPEPLGARHPLSTPFDVFKARDSSLTICVGNDADFRKLAVMLGRPEWATDPRFHTNDARHQHQALLKEQIESVLAWNDRGFWLDKLEHIGVAAGPLNNMADVAADPQVQARNMLITVGQNQGGMRYAAMPYKISTMSEHRQRRVAPSVGADRAHILSSLGIDDGAGPMTKNGAPHG